MLEERLAVGSPEGKEEEKNPVGGGLLWSVVVSGSLFFSRGRLLCLRRRVTVSDG